MWKNVRNERTTIATNTLDIIINEYYAGELKGTNHFRISHMADKRIIIFAYHFFIIENIPYMYEKIYDY